MGLRPGLGMFFLATIAAAAWVLSAIFGKNVSNVTKAAKPVYQCSACGAKANPSDKFCSACGASVVSIEPVQDVAQSEEISEESDDNIKKFDYSVISKSFKGGIDKTKDFMKKKNITPMMLYIAGGALIFTIVAAIVLISILCGPSATYMLPESDSFYVYNNADDETIIISNAESMKPTIEGEIDSAAQSINGKAMALLTEDEMLYVYYNDSLIVVSEEVQSYKLSAEGEAIAYVNADDELVLYTLKDKKSKMITDELIANSTMYYDLSPDGNSIVYTEGTLLDSTLYVYTDDERSKVKDNAIPFGLSNDAELIYYYSEENNSLYVLNKDDGPIKLISGSSDLYDSYSSISFRFNADHTQALFGFESKWYISDNGQEKQKISSRNITQFGDFYTFGLILQEKSNVITTPIFDFKNQYFVDANDTMYYLNKNFEAIEVADDVDEFKTTIYSDVVYYLNYDGELYRSEGYDEAFRQIAYDVDNFVITSDGSRCYFIDDDDTLRYVKKFNKAERIADDVDVLRITNDDYALFITDYSGYMMGGTLYSSHNGKEKERISDDVVTLYIAAESTYYYCQTDDGYNTCDVYGSLKNTDFVLIAREIEK